MLLTRSKVFLTLTKARLSFSVVFSTIAGYVLATDNVDFFDILLLLFGGYCMVGASNSFNQIIEKDKDALMDRTKSRPLPTKKNIYIKCILDKCYFDTYWIDCFVYN